MTMAVLVPATTAPGLATFAAGHGFEALGVCAAVDCGRVFANAAEKRPRRFYPPLRHPDPSSHLPSPPVLTHNLRSPNPDNPNRNCTPGTSLQELQPGTSPEELQLKGAPVAKAVSLEVWCLRKRLRYGAETVGPLTAIPAEEFR